MPHVTLQNRWLHRLFHLGVWVSVGSLALVSTSQAIAAVAPRPVDCAVGGSCASQPAGAFSLSIIDTGAPDGRMAMASRIEGHSLIEIEAADDFSTTVGVRIHQATLNGLLPSAAPLADIEDVDLEIYRIFPLDSNALRTINVPTRANSPSDVDFGERSASEHQLEFVATLVNANFSVANSVLNGIHPKPNQTTGGDGAVNGEEVQINATLSDPFILAPGHYFFIPKVKLSSGTWFWLSAPGPALFPGDLQAWIRDANLDPDWLRVGTDIVGGGVPPKFNASFVLSRGIDLFLPLVQR